MSAENLRILQEKAKAGLSGTDLSIEDITTATGNLANAVIRNAVELTPRDILILNRLKHSYAQLPVSGSELETLRAKSKGIFTIPGFHNERVTFALAMLESSTIRAIPDLTEVEADIIYELQTDLPTSATLEEFQALKTKLSTTDFVYQKLEAQIQRVKGVGSL